MTQSRPPTTDPLEAAFAEARRSTPAMPDGLMGRVMADAIAEMPKLEPRTFWGQIFGIVGGWPAVAGLAMTACIGVWAGGALTDDLMLALTPMESASFDTGVGLGAFDLLLVEG